MTSNQIADIVSESLRDWFKKEKWVRISSSGNIAGDCGTSKNKKNPDRCLPKAKAQSLTKGQRAATAAKKKKAGSKGKTIVKNTKKATVKKEAYEPGSIAPEDLYYSDKHGKLVAMDDVDYKYHDSLELVYKKGDKIEGPMDEVVNEGRGDFDIIVRVITDMAQEDGTTPKEAALEVIEAIRDAYIIDAYDEGVVNEEATCCGKCGRVHVKGNCKRPFLKGKSHCRTK